MKHKNIVAMGVAILCMIFIALCVILVTPVRADYDGARVTTAKQDALHQAAEILRAAGYSDDDPAIKCCGIPGVS